MAAETLAAGKHVFVEKPLAVDEKGLEQVRQAYATHSDLQLMVGFNRRFAPHTAKVKELLASRSQPIAVEMMVNAGSIPPDHWAHDPEIGGGRVIGEGCHFIDLLMHIVGHPITSVQAVTFGGGGALAEDKMTIIMTYADGSIGTVHYWANGPKSYPKECVQIFSEGRVLMIDNWRRLRAWNWKDVPKMSGRQDKGHKAEVAQFVDRVAGGGPPLIPFTELELVTQATFAAIRSAREGVTIRLSRSTDQAAAAPPEATHAS
jgi:predicted dehydrogenase